MQHLLRPILLILITALFVTAALQLHDIVASALALATITLTAYITIFTLAQLFLTSKATIELSVLPIEGDKITSQTELRARVQIAALRIAPTFHAEITLFWTHSDVEQRPLVIKGGQSDYNIYSAIRFPHRANWHCSHATVDYSDPFGIILIRRTVYLNSTIHVAPVGDQSRLLDIISSASRPGDSAPSNIDRRGDPFEIKHYDPAEGSRNILWKIYAKRGELMGRAPEAAITPEGFTACIGVLKPLDDNLATKIASYLKMLEQHGISVAFNCLGNTGPIASTSDSAEQMMIDTVWASPTKTSSELPELINYCESYGEVTQIVVFASASLLASANTSDFFSLLSQLESRRIQPIIAVDIPTSAKNSLSNDTISRLTNNHYPFLEL